MLWVVSFEKLTLISVVQECLSSFFSSLFGTRIITVFIRHLTNSNKSLSIHHFGKLCSRFRSELSFLTSQNKTFVTDQTYNTFAHQGALDIKVSILKLCILVFFERFRQSFLLKRKYTKATENKIDLISLHHFQLQSK